MQPTNKLRFVARFVPIYTFSEYSRMAKILQQWWEDATGAGEWRDVMTTPEE